MRSVLWLVLLLASVPAWSEDIREVLDRSQRVRLESFARAGDQAARTLVVRASFDQIVRVSGLGNLIDLRVVRGDMVAETLRGRVVVANESLADLPEGERLFILAHELGHVAMDHWSQMGQLYKRYIPGEVTQDKTDPIAAALGRDASGLAHQHELDADAFSLRMLQLLGHSPDDAYAALRRTGVARDTPTHPGTRRRLAALRELQRAPISTAVLSPM